MKHPTVIVRTDVMMALVKVLDLAAPCLEDWIRTTGYGEINRRDRNALAAIQEVVRLLNETDENA